MALSTFGAAQQCSDQECAVHFLCWFRLQTGHEEGERERRERTREGCVAGGFWISFREVIRLDIIKPVCVGSNWSLNLDRWVSEMGGPGVDFNMFVSSELHNYSRTEIPARLLAPETRESSYWAYHAVSNRFRKHPGLFVLPHECRVLLSTDL